MSKSNTFENDLLLLVFNNTNISLVGDATGLRGSSAAGNLYVSLHTADPGEAGNQGTSEISYTGYARVAVARTSGGFTVSGNSVSPASSITFGQRTDVASNTATYFGIGTDSSGSGKLLYSGQITTPSGGIVVSHLVTPILTTSTAVTED